MKKVICNCAEYMCIQIAKPCKHATLHDPIELSEGFMCCAPRGECTLTQSAVHCVEVPQAVEKKEFIAGSC